ncbi:hypothetical protein LINGRAHAP2_LOCUS11022 [Linum grandiflorum]
MVFVIACFFHCCWLRSSRFTLFRLLNLLPLLNGSLLYCSISPFPLLHNCYDGSSASPSIQAFHYEIQDEDLDINEERNNLSLISLFLGQMAPMPLMIPIWIQLWDLPRSFCTSRMGHRLGPRLGQVLYTMLCEEN